MKNESLIQAKEAYKIEAECITNMLDYFDEDAFAKAVELLAGAARIGTCGCGHSGIICQHFSHLLCCIERPSRFISPAEAVHGATGFLCEGDVMVFASRGGKTKELMTLVMSLPPGFRTVFNMYAIEGYTHKEIADALGITETTSRTQLSRARIWLQNKIKERENV